ncbi:MAG: ECF transporter S component [Oscillospiraceae bacterium]|jgi:niacin transporter|nr:ECF transporter S component [Oscillospiraceae bacterium]
MRNNILKMVYSAVFTALGVVLPFAFHAVPNAGSVLLPMHIPVLLCGLICGFPYGLSCGVLTPILSSLLIGMPQAASLPGMLCELAVYGLVSSLLMQFVRTKNNYADICIALISAMLSGRIVYGMVNALIFSVGAYSFKLWATAAFITSIPGIIAQIIVIPILIVSLQKARLIDKRYA